MTAVRTSAGMRAARTVSTGYWPQITGPSGRDSASQGSRRPVPAELPIQQPRTHPETDRRPAHVCDSLAHSKQPARSSETVTFCPTRSSPVPASARGPAVTHFLLISFRTCHQMAVRLPVAAAPLRSPVAEATLAQQGAALESDSAAPLVAGRPWSEGNADPGKQAHLLPGEGKGGKTRISKLRSCPSVNSLKMPRDRTPVSVCTLKTYLAHCCCFFFFFK